MYTLNLSKFDSSQPIPCGSFVAHFNVNKIFFEWLLIAIKPDLRVTGGHLSA